jgi:hypothetical protein
MTATVGLFLGENDLFPEAFARFTIVAGRAGVHRGLQVVITSWLLCAAMRSSLRAGQVHPVAGLVYVRKATGLSLAWGQVELESQLNKGAIEWMTHDMRPPWS